jgi:hypothetical protein
MDAAEDEQDVQLQKAASGLLADFDSVLKPFLWRTLHNGKLQIRRRVRARETERLLRLVRCFKFQYMVTLGIGTNGVVACPVSRASSAARSAPRKVPASLGRCVS